MHGVNLKLPVHFYTDALNWAAGLAITQFQDATSMDSGKASSKGNSLVEVPIIYDLFL